LPASAAPARSAATASSSRGTMPPGCSTSAPASPRPPAISRSSWSPGAPLSGLRDYLRMGLLPPLEGLYRDDLCCHEPDLWERYRNHPGRPAAI